MLACFLSCLGAVLSCCHQTKHLKEESSFKIQPFHEVRIAQASITAALKANARKFCVSASLNPASVVAVPPPGIKHGFLLYFDAQDANLMSDNEEQSEAEPKKDQIVVDFARVVDPCDLIQSAPVRGIASTALLFYGQNPCVNLKACVLNLLEILRGTQLNAASRWKFIIEDGVNPSVLGGISLAINYRNTAMASDIYATEDLDI
ncbi:hypothetical protein OPV22_017554 [Ensete ventricosum]|uniref:Uncharacterized protein n=1 Tax=Ensete ventricosum TaxID=4639 RepID=A0AAV8R296_ENSVE|nr:hypothetical protein OPV22_017554 [Ensete ventricosum]